MPLSVFKSHRSKKTGEIAASDNKQMPSNQTGARSNTASMRVNVRLYTLLKLPFGVLVKGISER
jgi:hypothetical protein